MEKVRAYLEVMAGTSTKPEFECFDSGILRAPAGHRAGRAEIWKLHRRAAQLGGHLPTGLEDTFYLPDGRKARSNGELVEALARCAREAGSEIAGPREARVRMALR